MQRTLGIAGTCVLAMALSGCILDSIFRRRLQQAQAEVDTLETRVGVLEVSRGITRFTSPVISPGPLPSPTIPEAGLDATIVSGTVSAPRPVSRWPRMPFDSRRAIGKLIRGVTNIITGWVEIPKRVDETSEHSGPGAGLSWGLMRGVGYGFVRTAGGVYEVVTFPVPVPQDYQPIMRPVYVFRCEEVGPAP